MEFKELTIEELSQGFVRDGREGTLTCIFCGETFEIDMIYHSGSRLVNADRAMREHLIECHGGVFRGLLELDKQINGLSDIQKTILEGMYLEKDNKELGEDMNISAATVRTHKFNIQKMKREARILLALLTQIEDDDLVADRKKLLSELKEESPKKRSGDVRTIAEKSKALDRAMRGNSLHPFLTQLNMK